MEHEEWVWTGVYTLLSMITRYWRIGAANYVVWDEVSKARLPHTVLLGPVTTRAMLSVCMSLCALLTTPRRPISASSDPTTSTATSTLTYTPHSARCSSASPVF
jgi:hypothetical protein